MKSAPSQGVYSVITDRDTSTGVYSQCFQTYLVSESGQHYSIVLVSLQRYAA